MAKVTPADIERIKHEKDGLAVLNEIPTWIEQGISSISPEDLVRLKWLGLFYRESTPGLFMLRLRIPGGHLLPHHWRTIADLSRRYGKGHMDLTTRQSIQLRYIALETVPAIFSALREVGLSSWQTGMDSGRNILTCALAGHLAEEIIDTRPVVRELSRLFEYNPRYSNLPRKVNIAITGCPSNCVHAEANDIGFIPADFDGTKGFNVFVGGALAHQYRGIGIPLDVFVTPQDVTALTMALLDIYRDEGLRTNRSKSRLRTLVLERGADQLRMDLEHKLGHSLNRAGTDLRRLDHHDHLGLSPSTEPQAVHVGVHIPYGSISADDFEGLGELAMRAGSGELNLLPSQDVVLLNITNVSAISHHPLLARYSINPPLLERNAVACTGKPHCPLAITHTKEPLSQILSTLSENIHLRQSVTISFSGCTNACTQQGLADIALTGVKVKVGDQWEEGADILIGGQPGPQARIAERVYRQIPFSQLTGTLQDILTSYFADRILPAISPLGHVEPVPKEASS
ncbi:hypothetical protein [Sulfobacillus thermosulfidooxidans]|uniref:hypothetical protein n=1 Tax=Sulfobacillus thermosulfidooxidans TaxID=28034 RepID=UPI0006B55FB2|nr:hypothetical protein [Sulfobacillus thermosulfidooxidans]